MTNPTLRIHALSGDDAGPFTASPSDLLTDLELQVARRADELARVRPNATTLNLHCWLLAEAEILTGQVTSNLFGASPQRLLAN